MGFFFGAVFSGYGSLQPHDPSLRNWAAQPAGAAGAAPYAYQEPPKVPLLRALKEGLVEVRCGAALRGLSLSPHLAQLTLTARHSVPKRADENSLSVPGKDLYGGWRHLFCN